jgi:hypothetical protein
LHKKIENPVLDRGDNHHEHPIPLSRSNHPTGTFKGYPYPSKYQPDPLLAYRQRECSPYPHSFPEINRNENRVPTPHITRPNVTIKPQTFDGTEDFNDFLAHFEILVTLHGWDYMTKSLYLASSLSGNARSILTELNEVQRTDYKSLVDLLNRRFGSLGRALTLQSPT